MPVTATVNVSVSYGGIQRLAPKPAPAPSKPDEYWWIEWCEGMPLQPACISFEGDTPAKIQQLGDDSWGTPLADVPHIRLVERILPPGRAAEVVAILQEVHRDQSCSWPMRLLDNAMEMLLSARPSARSPRYSRQHASQRGPGQ
jgi:hypothetical protein